MFDLIDDLRRNAARLWRGFMTRHLGQLLNFYPPYLGAGIRVREVSEDFRHVEVVMDLAAYNRNYVGTHFGGSLYSMCDPFYMLMVMQNLGDDYIVWDKAATIRFRKPGRGRVRAVFELDQARLDQIRRLASEQRKVEPHFSVEVVDEAGDVVAEVDKVLYVRRKDGG